jgi:hypothetical protein
MTNYLPKPSITDLEPRQKIYTFCQLALDVDVQIFLRDLLRSHAQNEWILSGEAFASSLDLLQDLLCSQAKANTSEPAQDSSPAHSGEKDAE